MLTIFPFSPAWMSSSYFRYVSEACLCMLLPLDTDLLLTCSSDYAYHPYSMHTSHYFHVYHLMLVILTPCAFLIICIPFTICTPCAFTYTHPIPSMLQPHLPLVYKQLYNSYHSLASLCFPINETFFTFLNFTLKVTSLRTWLLKIALIVQNRNSVLF